MAAYLFYENGTKKITDNVPPLAKAVGQTQSPSVAKCTPVYKDSVDFFTFLMTAIEGGIEFPTAEDEKGALSMILSSASQDDLVAIVALGRTEDTQHRYESAYRTMRMDSSRTTEIDAADESDPSYSPVTKL